MLWTIHAGMHSRDVVHPTIITATPGQWKKTHSGTTTEQAVS